jgi:hypothetical protein
LAHAADLTIQGKRGMGVFKTAEEYSGGLRVKALGKAIKNWKRP